jgi:hypothetical protein
MTRSSTTGLVPNDLMLAPAGASFVPTASLGALAYEPALNGFQIQAPPRNAASALSTPPDVTISAAGGIG